MTEPLAPFLGAGATKIPVVRTQPLVRIAVVFFFLGGRGGLLSVMAASKLASSLLRACALLKIDTTAHALR